MHARFRSPCYPPLSQEGPLLPSGLQVSTSYDCYVPSRKYSIYRENISNSDDGTGGGGCLAPPKQEHRRHSLTDRIANALKL